MTELCLTPIGTSPAWYNPGEPTSGFLLESDGYRLLVDCGAGVISRFLERWGTDTPIDAIVISHCHADHVSDLVPLKYGLDYGGLDWKPQLWLPPGAHARLRTMVSAWDGAPDFFSATYDVRDYDVESPFEAGPFTVRATEVPHYIESYALRFEASGASFGYTADLGPAADIASFMRGVDLLLCEATEPEEQNGNTDGRGHLTGTEAGAIAREAEAHSLLLTHVPESIGPDTVLAAAREAFGRPVALAHSGERYPIAQRLAHAV
jgi:ribonuclease BN (tRNA processing enzyme)